MKKNWTSIVIKIQTFDVADIVKTSSERDGYEGEIDWSEGYVSGTK